MTSRPWAILRDAGIVYGLTFAAGIGMASIGVTLQSSPWTAYLANLLSGALGFLASGIRANSDRVEHLAWVAATLWTCNLLNVALRLQSTASWIHSGITVILMVDISTLQARERQRFIQTHPASMAQAAAARRHYLFGVPLHWMRDWPTPAALHVQRAQGNRLWCADGHEYLDFCLGDTGAMFGHSPAPVARAIAATSGICGSYTLASNSSVPSRRRAG